jgi:hypothetical protein
MTDEEYPEFEEEQVEPDFSGDWGSASVEWAEWNLTLEERAQLARTINRRPVKTVNPGEFL